LQLSAQTVHAGLPLTRSEHLGTSACNLTTARAVVHVSLFVKAASTRSSTSHLPRY